MLYFSEKYINSEIVTKDMLHQFMTTEVKLGKKGQITIPKVIRDEDNLQEDDVFTVTHMPGGDIILSQQKVEKDPIDRLLEFLETQPRINAREAWEEIKEERKRERS